MFRNEMEVIFIKFFQNFGEHHFDLISATF